ncbi:putative cardiolipin synthase [Evansella vedderi]|uniref:Cardiolipin synthase n=1 Tax=Evansella vedderi TaxID=38282 RepID=A0ABT9ZZR3_9BACI|nr:phospholipase D family protein [Evansella vedderi]MDQ0256744.1 putative cardiolipin synthase [Evansella vedderi]
MKKHGINVIKIITLLLSTYIIYVLLAGVLLFQFHTPDSSNYREAHDPERFFGDKEVSDRVVLVEDRMEAGLVRINLIENAEETIDLAYFTIHKGIASDVLFSSIVDAADRGVKVRFLLDGIFHNLRGDLRDIIYAYSYHPNIDLKFYEPLDFLRPWTWNNRLHDKMIVVDNKLAMIGGRNIGDKYYAPEGYEGASNDRDVLVINTNAPETNTSVIEEINNYFQYVWDHEFTHNPATILSNRQERRAQEELYYLRELFQGYQASHSDLFQNEYDWLEKSFPANKVTFIHNPIERLNKEPWVWYELTGLMEKAEDSIFIQSPYVIPTDKMVQFIDKDKVTASEIKVLTNSLAASPNVLAYSGYMRYREELVRSGIDVYEFQGPTESLHGKTYIFDERITAIGAFNLDPRSTFLSTEVMVVIDSEAFASHLKNKVNTLKNEGSLQVKSDGSYKESLYVVEEDVSLVKRGGTRVLSWITRFVEYLL